MSIPSEDSLQLPQHIPKTRFHELLESLPEELRQMIWSELQNVPRPCMYTLLGFARMDHDPIRQHLEEVLRPTTRSFLHKSKIRYQDPGCSHCYFHYFDMFEPEKDVLFLPNRRVTGPDWFQRKEIVFAMNYRNFAAVRYLVYRTPFNPYQPDKLHDMDIEFLSKFPFLKVLWLEHPKAHTQMQSSIEHKSQIEIEEEITRSIITEGKRRVEEETWGNIQADGDESFQCLDGRPKPGLENIQYRTPKIKFLTTDQLKRLCGYYQMNICGEVEVEHEELNDELEEGEIDQTLPIRTYGALRENVTLDFDIFLRLESKYKE